MQEKGKKGHKKQTLNFLPVSPVTQPSTASATVEVSTSPLPLVSIRSIIFRRPSGVSLKQNKKRRETLELWATFGRECCKGTIAKIYHGSCLQILKQGRNTDYYIPCSTCGQDEATPVFLLAT